MAFVYFIILFCFNNYISLCYGLRVKVVWTIFVYTQKVIPFLFFMFYTLLAFPFYVLPVISVYYTNKSIVRVFEDVCLEIL